MSSCASTRSSSSCAACKMLKRRCRANCIFAPHFRADEGRKFAKVHKVFGASNVSKLLVEVPPEQREDAVNSLAYEAEARLLDPVYGCIGAIALLHRRLSDLHRDLALARARLARYVSIQSSSSAGFDNSSSVYDYDHDHAMMMMMLMSSSSSSSTSSSSSSSSSSSMYNGNSNSNNDCYGYGYDYGFVLPPPYIL